MLKSVATLLRADVQGWLNGVRHGGESWRKAVLKGIGYLVFVIALWIIGNSLFTHLQVTEAAPALILGVMNGFILFGIIVVAKELMESSLKDLYQAPDTALLHAAPIQPIAIFGYKFIHLILTHFLSAVCFLAPPWVAFGLIFELPWYFFLVFFPVCFFLLVMVTGYVTLSVMVIARFFSSGWLLTTLKVVGTSLGVIVGFLLSLTLFFEFEPIQIKELLLKWASERSAGTTSIWSPYGWMGQFLLGWVDQSAVGVRLKWLLGGAAGSLVAAGVATLVARLIYQRGWENIRHLRPKRKPGRSAKESPPEAVRFTFGRGKIQTLMLKDFLTFVRQSGRLIPIVMLTVFLVVHIGILFAEGETVDTSNGTVLVVQIVLYSLLITFGISCNGLRDEAKAWWMLRIAPITPRLVFMSKYLTALLCATVYAEFWLLCAIGILGVPGDSVLPMLLMPLLTLPAACAMNTAVGTLPWMAELTNQRRPLLRVLTFTATLTANTLLVLIPVFAWRIKGLLVFIALIALSVGVFIAAYISGLGNLRKLLAANP